MLKFRNSFKFHCHQAQLKETFTNSLSFCSDQGVKLVKEQKGVVSIASVNLTEKLASFRWIAPYTSCQASGQSQTSYFH